MNCWRLTGTTLRVCFIQMPSPSSNMAEMSSNLLSGEGSPSLDVSAVCVCVWFKVQITSLIILSLQLATSKNTSLLLFPLLLRVAMPLQTWSHRLLPPLKTAMHRTTWTPSTRDVAQEISSVLLSALHPTSSSQQGGKRKWNSYVLCSLAVIAYSSPPSLY